MPLTTVGTITIDTRIRTTTFFPATTFTNKNYLLFTLEAAPISTTVQFYSLEIIPVITISDGTFQRPTICSFQPDKLPLLAKVSNFKSGKPTDTLKIGVKPVGKWVSRFKPTQLVLTLKKSSDTSEDSLIVL